jgi:hypothetical protein
MPNEMMKKLRYSAILICLLAGLLIWKDEIDNAMLLLIFYGVYRVVSD